MHYYWGQTTAKIRNVVNLNSAHQVAMHIQEQQPNQFNYCNKNMCFVSNRLRNGQAQDWYPNEKIGAGPHLFEWDVVLKGVLLLYHINKNIGNQSMLFLPFRRNVVNAIFLKYQADHPRAMQEFKISHQMSAIMTKKILYLRLKHPCDDTKYYQVQSEHRRIQNLFKHLRQSFLCTQLTAWSH